MYYIKISGFFKLLYFNFIFLIALVITSKGVFRNFYNIVKKCSDIIFSFPIPSTDPMLVHKNNNSFNPLRPTKTNAWAQFYIFANTELILSLCHTEKNLYFVG